MAGRYSIYGALGSPYSMKMRALMRYRRIPHLWIDAQEARQQALAQVRVPVIPVLEYPDGSFHNDSTPLIFDLERRHDTRSVVPERPAHAFLAYLIEDFADEWLTKAMFMYRWRDEADQRQLAEWLVFDSLHGGGRQALDRGAAAFRQRQVERLPMVSGGGEGFALVEASTRRLLSILEAHVVDGFFLFGSRPSLAEFGLFGQLKQLAVDPTPQKMMRAEFPLTYRWLDHVEDLSGVEGEWQTAEGPGRAVLDLTTLIGEVYLPFLAANEQAVREGADSATFQALGCRYSQAPFKFQTKCLAGLRSGYSELTEKSRSEVDDLLAATPGLAVLQEG